MATSFFTFFLNTPFSRSLNDSNKNTEKNWRLFLYLTLWCFGDVLNFKGIFRSHQDGSMYWRVEKSCPQNWINNSNPYGIDYFPANNFGSLHTTSFHNPTQENLQKSLKIPSHNTQRVKSGKECVRRTLFGAPKKQN